MLVTLVGGGRCVQPFCVFCVYTVLVHTTLRARGSAQLFVWSFFVLHANVTLVCLI